MHLMLNRHDLLKDRTFGEILVDGQHECWCLEDAVREEFDNGKWVWKPEFKQYGRTAIPSGVYEVVITFSNRFKRQLPLLMNVPNFVGIRIHPGNTEHDTEGCILPGMVMTTTAVLQSNAAFVPLYEKIQRAARAGKVFIEINNPPRYE